MSSVLTSPYSFWISSVAVIVINIALIIYGGALTAKEHYSNSPGSSSPSMLRTAKYALQTHLVFGRKMSH
jgi:hypothetical protein